MPKILTAGIVSGVLTAIFVGSPAGVLGQGLTVSGYADFEAVVNNLDGSDQDFYYDNHHFNLIMVASIVEDLSAELEQAEIIRVATLVNVAPAMADPANVYESQCKVCHGASGKGDGVAAVAYNPKPRDFTDAAFATSRTLDQVVAVITHGKNAMPPFAGAISLEEIRALAGYLLKLGEVNR